MGVGFKNNYHVRIFGFFGSFGTSDICHPRALFLLFDFAHYFNNSFCNHCHILERAGIALIIEIFSFHAIMAVYMKSLFTIFLITSFVAVAVFGFMAMKSEHHAGCIAATTQEMGCPGQNDPLVYLNFHFDAFKNFSTATLGNALSLLLSFLLAVATAFQKGFTPKRFAYSKYRRLDSSNVFSQDQFTHWLALHEISPTLS